MYAFDYYTNVCGRTGHAGAVGVLHALYLRSRQGGSFVVQCALLVANMQLLSYGKYSDEQQTQLKARNKGLVGSVRYYDEIVSHGKNLHAVKGFMADRPFENAVRPEYFQRIDGSVWGGLGDVHVVRLPVRFKGHDGKSGMRSDWAVGAYPPGYHKAAWKLEINSEFEPIMPAEFIQS